MKNWYILSAVIQLCFAGMLLAQKPGDQLFDNLQVHEIKIVSLKENLRDTLEANYVLSYGMNQIQVREIPYAAVKLVIDGAVLDTLGIRYKGFNSWWHSVKKPIKIDINRYKKGQEYDGLKKFNLHNGSGDPSFMRENLSYQMLRSLGIKVPRTAYAKVFIDSEYIGLYRIVEQIDNTFLDVNFGNHDGNLYKQKSANTAGFPMLWKGSDQEAYYSSVSLENHQTGNDWSRLIHLLDVLNNTGEKQFRDSILRVFNVDEFLQVLAFDVAINNLDFYGNSGRNFYLYDDNGKFYWVPWDYNLSWAQDAGRLDVDPSAFPVLIRRILEVPEFYALFLRKYCLLKPLFSTAVVREMVQKEYDFLSPLLENDPFEDYPYDAFLQNTDAEWQRIPGLLPFAAGRTDEIANVLDRENVDCNFTETLPERGQEMPKIYPVPATDKITVELSSGVKARFCLLNSKGQCVLANSFTSKVSLDVSNLPSGFYIARVSTEKQILTQPVIINR